MSDPEQVFFRGQQIAPPMQPTIGRDAPSMFPRIGSTLDERQEEAQQMAEQFQKFSHNKLVLLKEVNVKTFDLGVQEDVEEYQKLYLELYNGAQSGQIMVKDLEKRFVEKPQPRWIIHIEWWVYGLMVDGKEVTPEELEEMRKADSIQTPGETEPPAHTQLPPEARTAAKKE